MFYLCQKCGDKITGNVSHLTEIKSIIPKKADGICKDIIEHKKYKCPQCGFVLDSIKVELPKKEDKLKMTDLLPQEEPDHLADFEKDILKSIRCQSPKSMQ